MASARGRNPRFAGAEQGLPCEARIRRGGAGFAPRGLLSYGQGLGGPPGHWEAETTEKCGTYPVSRLGRSQSHVHMPIEAGS